VLTYGRFFGQFSVSFPGRVSQASPASARGEVLPIAGLELKALVAVFCFINGRQLENGPRQVFAA
jgi:hypothetical protein